MPTNWQKVLEDHWFGETKKTDFSRKGSIRAAKYKEKKTVKNNKGEESTVYEYSDRQVNKRHKEKSKKVEKIRKIIGDLEKSLYKDLASVEKKEVALAVALINQTYERVGNDESAANGHFGVTGWKKKHLSFKGDKAVLKYTGKSGVRHEKIIDDAKLIKPLKEISKNKSAEDTLLEEVSAQDVNAYLDAFGITAKDIRGYHANREMQERLKALRDENGELPKNRKEKDEILKKEFSEALKGAAEAVGHEEATLRNQYLVPHLEDTYMKDGTVITCLKKATVLRIAAEVFATKSESEVESEQVERLVRKAPKKKPPRKDRRRTRMEIEDTETDKDPDLNNKDMSLNYKVVGGSSKNLIATRVATRYLMTKTLTYRWLSKLAVEKRDLKDGTYREESEEQAKAWEKFIETQKFKSSETGRDVSFGTLEKQNPEKAKKIREGFHEAWEEKAKKDKDKKTKDKKERKEKYKKRKEEEAKTPLDSTQEYVDVGGDKVRVDKNVETKRLFRKNLQSRETLDSFIEDLNSVEKKEGESEQDFELRQEQKIKEHLTGLTRAEKLDLMKSGVFEPDNPKFDEAREILDKTFDSNKSYCPPRAVNCNEEELSATMNAVYDAILGDTLSEAIKAKQKKDAESEADLLEFFKDFTNSLTEAASEEGGDLDVEKEVSKFHKQRAQKKNTRVNESLINSDKAKKNPEAVKALKEAEAVLAETQKKRQDVQDKITKFKQDKMLGWRGLWPSDQRKLDKMEAELEELGEEITKQTETMNNARKELGWKPPKPRTELLKEYEELIKNSKMSPKEKKKALERAKDPSFDPEAALGAIRSNSEGEDGDED